MSAPTVEFIPGPPSDKMTRSACEAALRRHPAIRKGAGFALEQHQGHWVAAIIHQAAPPFGGPAGPPSDDDDAGAPPAPPEDAEDSAPPSDDGGEGPPKKDGEKKDKEGGELKHVMDALQQIADALGIPLGLGDSPVPGPDAGAMPGPGGPPPGPPMGGPSGPDTKVHQRALKPGETPPGGTPVGAPAFASVREDHPWAHVAGKVASFKVADEIGDAPMEEVFHELTSLANEIGYRAQVREARSEDGKRIAEALITQH